MRKINCVKADFTKYCSYKAYALPYTNYVLC
jgi:hypothetical protein